MQISKFYTFYDFNYRNGSPPFRPLIQHKLRRKMECLVDLYPHHDQAGWVNYFLEIIKDSSAAQLEKQLAYWHLLAYLDLDRCYLIWRNFRQFPIYTVKSQELYDFTNNILFQPDKFQKYLYKYDARNASGANLKTYILSILRNAMREKLGLASSWHILCDIEIKNPTKFARALKKRRDALERYGVSEPHRSCYIFALKYFILVYKTNHTSNAHRIEGSRWPKAKAKDFRETANYYNSRRFMRDAPLQASAGENVTSETIRKWMNICIKALRYQPSIIETNYSINNYEQFSSSINLEETSLDEHPDLLQKTDLLLRKTIQTIQYSYQKIHSKIPWKFRLSIMPLCYPHSLALLNQERLGNKIGVHQGTISRYVHKYFEAPLLNKFKQFADDEINLESYLTIFLEKRFINPQLSNLPDKILIEAIQALDDDSQKILKFRYSQKMNAENIALVLSNQKSRKVKEIDSILLTTRNKLQEELLAKLATQQARYIKLWLKKYYQDIIHTVLFNSFKELNFVRQEILYLRYCYKMEEQEILNIYPHCDPTKVILESKKQLHRSVLIWSVYTMSISLVSESQQVMAIVENWLSNSLIYTEL